MADDRTVVGGGNQHENMSMKIEKCEIDNKRYLWTGHPYPTM